MLNKFKMLYQESIDEIQSNAVRILDINKDIFMSESGLEKFNQTVTDNSSLDFYSNDVLEYTVINNFNSKIVEEIIKHSKEKPQNLIFLASQLQNRMLLVKVMFCKNINLSDLQRMAISLKNGPKQNALQANTFLSEFIKAKLDKIKQVKKSFRDL